MNVLITGCSTGIGRATALRLARGGWTVYASARRVETLTELEQAGCHVLALDVTDEASMQAAVAGLDVDVLINNAGYSQSGALEALPMESVRRQFETNVFGALRLTQLVLPGMRTRGRGKIVMFVVDGRAPRLRGRRRLPRHQVRSRGAVRRAADGGRVVRHRGHLRRAGADSHRVRVHGGGRGARGRRAVRAVERGGRAVDAGRLLGSSVAAGRRRRLRGARDRGRVDGAAGADAGAGDGERSPVH